MKTTIHLPDELLIAAKKRADEGGITLREIFERALRRELADKSDARDRPRRIRWVTGRGGLPSGLDIASRVAMHEWIARHR